MLCAADRIIVAKKADQEALLARYALDAGKIRVIPNFVDTARFVPDPNEPREAGRICCVARLEPQKNLFALLDAIGGISGVRLSLIGEGSLRTMLERHTKMRGLPVDFLGTVAHEQLPKVLQCAELFVLPSHYEGHPKALLEAMACGVPVLGTNVPGIRGVIEHGKTGYLCGTSAAELAQGISAVMREPQLRHTMADAAQVQVTSTCALERVLEQELAVLAEVVQ